MSDESDHEDMMSELFGPEVEGIPVETVEVINLPPDYYNPDVVPANYTVRKCQYAGCETQIFPERTRRKFCEKCVKKRQPCGVDGCLSGARINGLCLKHAANKNRCVVKLCREEAVNGNKCRVHALSTTPTCMAWKCDAEAVRGNFCAAHTGLAKRCKYHTNAPTPVTPMEGGRCIRLARPRKDGYCIFHFMAIRAVNEMGMQKPQTTL